MMCGKIRTESSVFVHPGTDCAAAVAISIALGRDCEVFTAVDTLEEKKYLRKRFPRLREENIGKLQVPYLKFST